MEWLDSGPLSAECLGVSLGINSCLVLTPTFFPDSGPTLLPVHPAICFSKQATCFLTPCLYPTCYTSQITCQYLLNCINNIPIFKIQLNPCALCNLLIPFRRNVGVLSCSSRNNPHHNLEVPLQCYDDFLNSLFHNTFNLFIHRTWKISGTLKLFLKKGTLRCLFSSEREDFGRLGGSKDLGGAELEETVIRIHCMTEIYIQLTKYSPSLEWWLMSRSQP